VNADYFVAKVLISSYIIRDLSARPLLVFLFLVRAPDLIHLYQLLIYIYGMIANSSLHPIYYFFKQAQIVSVL